MRSARASHPATHVAPAAADALAAAILVAIGSCIRRGIRVPVGLLATPLGLPRPNIDVWSWTQACIRALLHGVHPYTVQAKDVVSAADIWRTAAIYPYMPLTIVAFAPGYALFGDYRFVSALCVPATVALNRATGRRLALDPSFIDAATLAFLLFPRAIELTCFGWTEPLLVVTLAAFVYLAARAPGSVAEAVAFFLLPALK